MYDAAHDQRLWLIVFLIGLAIELELALVNYGVAKLAEYRHPPTGSFMDVDGVRLHYTDHGAGLPIVLLHGNAVTGADFTTSGVAERLAKSYRVIVFDRPGFGYSHRPRGRVWTATAQADLLRQALIRLDVHRPILVGHSWGTLVALAMAERERADTAGLVLLAGYYFPSARLDALLVAPVATPVLGDVLRYTLSPLLGWLTMPAMKRAMFAPSEMTARFKREYSTAMALRPWQIGATASDGTLMVPSAIALSARYGELGNIPVVIIAGSGDLVVGYSQAQQLQRAIPGSRLQVLDHMGHMLHHVATDRVVEAVEDVVARTGPGQLAPQSATA